MTAVGRGSAFVKAGGLLLCLLLVALHLELSSAAKTYSVGNAGGWTFNVSGWPKGKRFRAGDTLVFKYGQYQHNVVRVNKAGYNACTTPRGSKFYTSGNDRIKLVKGKNYFICSFSGHCQAQMKINVTAR